MQTFDVISPDAIAISSTAVRGATAAQSLCLACGMCCDGTLFDWAPLTTADDHNLLRAANIIPIEGNGKRKFSLPCHHHQNQRCNIYGAWRPHICGAYECKLLKRYGRGEVDCKQALDIIRKTLLHRDEVRAQMLALSDASAQGLRELYRTLKNSNTDSVQSAKRYSRVILNYIALQARLDRYFREKKKSPSDRLDFGGK